MFSLYFPFIGRLGLSVTTIEWLDQEVATTGPSRIKIKHEEVTIWQAIDLNLVEIVACLIWISDFFFANYLKFE